MNGNSGLCFSPASSTRLTRRASSTRKLSFGLFALLACAWGCSPLADAVADGDGGDGDAMGGGDSTMTSGPGTSEDGGNRGHQDGATSDAGSAVSEAGIDGSRPSDAGPPDSGAVTPVEAAPPPPPPLVCSEANAPWVAGAGISMAGWAATATPTAATDTNPGDFDVANAFDGDLTTRWSSGAAQVGGEGFRLDLGRIQTVSQVAFFDKTDFPAEYTLWLSSDDVNYTQVATGLGAQPTAICFPAQPARYIKILQTGTTGSWFSIYEVSVFSSSTASDAGPPDDASADAAPPLACSEANAAWSADAGIGTAGWSATASATAATDTNGGDFNVANAFDGNLATRWSSGKAQVGGEWFRLDLGQAQTISQVAFFDETDFPAEYTLALSSDDVTYTAVASGVGAQPTAICFPAGSARYIKITQTGATGSWFSIYEISVFANSATNDGGPPLDASASEGGSQVDDASSGDGGSTLDDAAAEDSGLED